MNNHKRATKQLYVALAVAQVSLSVLPANAQGLLDGFFQPVEPRTSPAPAVEPDAPPDRTSSTPRSPRARAAAPARIVPLPPPRPARLDEAKPEPTNEAESASLPATTTEAEPKPDAKGQPDPTPPPQQAGQGAVLTKTSQRTITLLVRAGVRGPEDLEGARIALVQQDQKPENVSALLQAEAGVRLNTVSSDWSAALTGLARGDVAGVVVSIGPALSGPETAGLDLKGYRLMELPVH